MFRRLAAASSLALVAACATTPRPVTAPVVTAPAPAPLPRTGKANYSLPIPSGWEELAHEKISGLVGPLGLALRKNEGMAVPDYFRASIVVTSVADTSDLPEDEAKCAETAAELGAAVKASVESSRLVPLPAMAKSCQMNVIGSDNPNRRARASVVASPAASYVVTCNYDARDAGALEGCEQVLQGFSFLAEGSAASAP